MCPSWENCWDLLRTSSMGFFHFSQAKSSKSHALYRLDLSKTLHLSPLETKRTETSKWCSHSQNLFSRPILIFLKKGCMVSRLVASIEHHWTIIVSLLSIKINPRKGQKQLLQAARPQPQASVRSTFPHLLLKIPLTYQSFHCCPSFTLKKDIHSCSGGSWVDGGGRSVGKINNTTCINKARCLKRKMCFLRTIESFQDQVCIAEPKSQGSN